MQAHLPTILKHKSSLKHIAFFYWVKLNFHNSCIFNYSSRNLASKLTGLSHSQIARYVKQLRAIGYVRNHCGNLIFERIDNHETNSRPCTLILTKKYSIHEIEIVIQSKIAEMNFERQQYLIKKKDEVRELSQRLLAKDGKVSKKEMRFSTTQKYQKLLGSLINKDITITNSNLAKLLGVSIKRIPNIKTTWKNRRIFTIESGKECLGSLAHCKIDISGVFYYKGLWYKNTPTTYKVIHNFNNNPKGLKSLRIDISI